MGIFSTELSATLKTNKRSSDGRLMWHVDQPLVFLSDITNQIYVVPKGFFTDFATVPRVPIIFDIFGDTIHAPATLHDWLYSNGLESRLVCDRILKEATLAIGEPEWKATMIYWAVRLFGWRFYKQKKEA